MIVVLFSILRSIFIGLVLVGILIFSAFLFAYFIEFMSALIGFKEFANKVRLRRKDLAARLKESITRLKK